MKTWTQNMSRNAKVKKKGAKLGHTGGKRIVAILLYINNQLWAYVMLGGVSYAMTQ
jgi:hypothetical protein